MSDDPGFTVRQPAGTPGVTRFATRGNHRLSYESSGAGDGIAVIALHDLLAGRGVFRPLGDMLREQGFRVTLPDARGHGASPMIAGRGFATRELAADAAAVLDAEGLPTAHVVAVGWGAMIALELAHIAPERVHSMVLAAPYVPGLLAEHASGDLRREGLRHKETLVHAASAAEKGQVDRALDFILESRLGEGWRERLAKPRLAAIRRSAASLGPLLSSLTADSLGREELATIETPAAILVPEGASTLTRGMGELLAVLLPRAQMVSIAADPEAQAAPDAGWSVAIARALGGDN